MPFKQSDVCAHVSSVLGTKLVKISSLLPLTIMSFGGRGSRPRLAWPSAGVQAPGVAPACPAPWAAVSPSPTFMWLLTQNPCKPSGTGQSSWLGESERGCLSGTCFSWVRGLPVLSIMRVPGGVFSPEPTCEGRAGSLPHCGGRGSKMGSAPCGSLRILLGKLPRTYRQLERLNR